MWRKALSSVSAGLHQEQKKVKKRLVYIHTEMDFDRLVREKK